ncbi:hypothetical protein, partial [Microcystis sp. M169S2]|uniref:hypothetical protein n=1 Tax=Microcystis sp. M169S2 TaxID=2771157 RepID=UPI00258373F1
VPSIITTNTIHKGCLFPLSFRKSLTCFSFSIKLNIYFKSWRSLIILPDSDRLSFYLIAIAFTFDILMGE